jgi:hypothetical protein
MLQVDKRISLNTILSICGLLVAFGAGWGAVANQSVVDEKQDHELQRVRTEIREDLREVNRKLDQLIMKGR